MWRTRFLALCAPVLLFAACGPETALSDDELTRADIKGGTPANDFPASCLIDIYDKNNKNVALCSGALIAPSAVLTAGHCVSGFDHYVVTCPYRNQTAKGVGEQHPNYHVGPSGSISPTSDDIGLIYLDRRLPGTYATLRRTPVPDDTLVVNVGRVLDGVPSRKELYRSAAIRVRDGKTINFSHDYVSVDKIQPGDSGGPTYRDGSKPPELVAVNSGAGDGFAVLARIDIVMSWITERVNQNGGFALPPGYQALTPQKPGLVDRNP
jgi:secreted trypsin-like serine protease